MIRLAGKAAGDRHQDRLHRASARREDPRKPPSPEGKRQTPAGVPRPARRRRPARRTGLILANRARSPGHREQKTGRSREARAPRSASLSPIFRSRGIRPHERSGHFAAPLISVSDKTWPSSTFARFLNRAGRGADLHRRARPRRSRRCRASRVTEVSAYTGFPEIMDGAGEDPCTPADPRRHPSPDGDFRGASVGGGGPWQSASSIWWWSILYPFEANGSPPAPSRPIASRTSTWAGPAMISRGRPRISTSWRWQRRQPITPGDPGPRWAQKEGCAGPRHPGRRLAGLGLRPATRRL